MSGFISSSMMNIPIVVAFLQMILIHILLELSGMAKSAGPPAGIFQFGDLLQVRSDKPGKDHLRNSLTLADEKSICSKINDDDTDLSSIIRVDGPGRVDKGDPVS